MLEKDLIKKIKELKQIKPKQEWVISCKEEIIGKSPTTKERFSAAISDVFYVFNYRQILKPALATALFAGFLIGVFTMAQNTLPGDFLYSAKKITEQIKLSFTSEQEKPKVQLAITNKKLQELTEVAEANLGKNLAPAIEEVKHSIAEAAKNLPQPKEIEDAVKIKQEITKLSESTQEIKTYGVITDDIDKELGVLEKNYEENLQPIVEREIQNLENQTLTEAQEELLSEAKVYLEDGSYSQALEKIWLLSYYNK